MSFRPLDVYPPSVSDSVRCERAWLTVSDTLLGDKGVFTITVDAQENVRIGNFTVVPGSRQAVEIPVQLADPTQDGFVAITAKDVEDQLVRKRVDIPGRTIAPVGHDPSTGPQQRTWEIAIRQDRCDTIRLVNYGRFPQTLTQLAFTSGSPVNIATPYTIQPGDTLAVVTCRRYDTAYVFTDKLILALQSDSAACATDGVTYTITVKTDELFPRVTRLQDTCSPDVRITIRDDDPADFGLEYVRIVDSLTRNCTITVTGNLPFRQDITFSVIDPYDDAMYYVEARDSAGNVEIIADTLFGNTLELAGVRGPLRDSLRFDVALGGLRCDTVTVRNYGIGAIVLDRVFMMDNRRFSLPPGQVPLTLQPGDSGVITICYEPIDGEETIDFDSLVITRNCIPVRLDVRGLGIPTTLQGVTRCDVPVEVSILRTAVALPMPASNTVTLAVSKPISQATIRLINTAGIEVVRMTLPPGTPTRAVRLDVSSVPDGLYVGLVEADGTTQTVPVVVRH
jgi:hypothetical protein